MKKQLTIEEKLQNALVPKEEQPYKIPNNWCWTYLTKGMAECWDKYRKPINATERNKRLGNIPYYGATGQVGWIDDYLTDEHLVLIGEDGAPFLDLLKNKAYIIKGKSWVNNHAHILKSFYDEVGNKYLCNYLNVFNYKGYINGTTRLKLTQKNLDIIPIPLPPINEQQRIVNIIESLFIKLDRAKELIENTLVQFEQNKMAILHKAFTGELTAKWRKENNLTLDSWENICLGKGLFPMKTRKPSGKTFRYIDIDAIDNKKQIVKEPKVILTEKAPSRASRAVENDDVLFSMVRPYLKNIALIDEKLSDCIASTGFYVCKCKPNLNAKFLYYLLCFDKTIDYLMQFMKGDNSPSIRKDDLLDMEIKLPTIEEQQEIVNIIDRIFIKYDKIKDLQAQIDKIELLKKSILAKAFRGELGTNDPNEESAEVLLRKILAEK
ncbi:MAG TPA: restriction endonuclease subunit S [Candidatus Megamonas gallistercoris]|nr:restriction endonuclease subunit S [Candidatus Megamonas gallistercoris]